MPKSSKNSEMPFLEHLEELRWRILWSLAAITVGVLFGFVIVLKFDVISLIAKPITPFMEGQKLIYTHPADPFSISMKIAFVLGFIFALPVILYQMWAFVSPALYPKEKKLVIPVLVGSTFLFAAGVALAYFVVLPLTLRFLLSLQSASLEHMISATEYFGFVTMMSLAFGATFQLPIVIVALTALGVLQPRTLVRYRRHALVLCFVAGAVITPGGDFTSMTALAVPLYLLYELSVVLSTMIDRRRRKRLQAEGVDGAAEGAPA